MPLSFSTSLCVVVGIARTHTHARTGRHISDSNSNVIRKCEQLATGLNELYTMCSFFGFFYRFVFCFVLLSHYRLTPIRYVVLPFFQLAFKWPIPSISYRSTSWQIFETNQIFLSIELYITFNEWHFCTVINVCLFVAVEFQQFEITFVPPGVHIM